MEEEEEEEEEKNLINSHNFLVSFNFFFCSFHLIYFSLSVKKSKKESPFIATKFPQLC